MLREGVPIKGLACDLCGTSLLAREDVRYIVRIMVYAAYDTMEITATDLEKGTGQAEWDRVLAACSALSTEELEDGVYREFAFDLCPPCQRTFLANPLGKDRVRGGVT